MASTSWEHQREVREALRTIVSDPQLGLPALSSSQTMSNLLKDLLPDAPRETSVLVAAAEAGLAGSLQDHVAQGMDIATASSLTASAFAARTPFTPDACTWVVGELAVALGLAPAAETGAMGGGAAGGGQVPPGTGRAPTGQGVEQTRQDPAVPAWGQGGGQGWEQGAGQDQGWAAPAQGPSGGQGWGAQGQGPAAGQGAAQGWGQGGAPQGPGAAQAQGWGGPAQGAAAGPGPWAGQTLPPGAGGAETMLPGGPATAGQGQGGVPGKRAVPKVWTILTGVVVVAAVAAAVIILLTRPKNSPVEALSKIIRPDVTSCRTQSNLSMRGTTSSLFCRTHDPNIGLNAYQFDNAPDYQAGLAHLHSITGWNPSAAGQGCPPPAGSSIGTEGWHTINDPKYRAQRPDQLLECYTDTQKAGLFLYLWTLPTQRVILVGADSSSGASYAYLQNWWKDLTYG